MLENREEMFLNIKDEFYELWKIDGEYMYFRSPINGNLMVVQKIGDRYLTLDGIPALTDEDIVASSIILRAEEPGLYEKITQANSRANTSRADFLCAYMYLKFYKEIGFEHCDFSKTLIWEKSMVNIIVDDFYGEVGMSKYIRKGLFPKVEYLDRLFIEHVGGVYDQKYYKKRDLTADECKFILLLIYTNYIVVDANLCIPAIQYAVQNNISVQTDIPIHLLIFEALEKKHILHDLNELPEEFDNIQDIMCFVILSDVDYLIQLVQNVRNINISYRQFTDILILKFDDWEKLYSLVPEIFDMDSAHNIIMEATSIYNIQFDFARLYNVAVVQLELFNKTIFMDMFFRLAVWNALSSDDGPTLRILMSFMDSENAGRKKYISDLIINRASYQIANEFLIIEDAESVIQKYQGNRDLDMEKLFISKMNLSEEPKTPIENAWKITRRGPNNEGPDNEGTITYYSYPPLILSSKFQLQSRLQMLNMLTSNILLINNILENLFDTYKKDEDIALIIKWAMQSRYKSAVRFNNMRTSITKNLVQALIENKVPFRDAFIDFHRLYQQICVFNNSYIEDMIEAYFLLKEHYDLDSLYSAHINKFIAKGKMDFDNEYRLCQILNLPKSAAIIEKFVTNKYPTELDNINRFLWAALVTQSFALRDWVIPSNYLLHGHTVSLIILTRNMHLLTNHELHTVSMDPIPTRNREFIYEYIEFLPRLEQMRSLFKPWNEYYINVYSFHYGIDGIDGIDALIVQYRDDIVKNLNVYIQSYKNDPRYVSMILTHYIMARHKKQGYADVDKIREYAMQMNEYLKYPTCMQFYRSN